MRTRPWWLAHLSVFLLSMVVCASLVTANAQLAQKMYRIGVLSELAPTVAAAGGPRPLFGENTWRTAFRHRGYVEGQNTLFEFRHAGERFEALPALADELIHALGQAPMSPDYSSLGRISARKAYSSFAMRCRISTRWPSSGIR
jgi:hypothetical protein